ncbi:arylsulfate sulfotransferase-like protein [Tepidicaulis marinus]|uniref:Arylsulfate sulfotransferase-like protein n=1 Tax=Tepidicaulis marinus TaxID=1333998 RepID=A0A081B9Y7_9HYPH|nr:ribbon-helix-helix domain-containing protein [Tepidicaulis marinus]GAK44855.1 arylsulfate sulfotransferase-like protein [Tepidicaulis marinus]
MGKIVKRSVSIAGHRTSISLERPFWEGLKELACSRKVSVNELIRQIDAGREEEENLSSALRVFVFKEMVPARACAATKDAPEDGEPS